MSRFLSQVCASMEVAVFTQADGGHFTLQSEMTEWLQALAVVPMQDGSYDLVSIFPYLGCFMVEAEQHWSSKKDSLLLSGSWIESDVFDVEWPLEAGAAFIDDQPVLVLQNLGERYHNEVKLLQHVRDGLLTQEILESEVHKRTLQIRQREENIAIKLISLTSYRDQETGTHVRRIGMYAAAMTKALKWDKSEIDNIRIAAPMHDLGKIGIPDSILLKAGALNDEEFEIMKQHTEIGASMLSGTGIPVLEMAAEIALCHHERWNGRGYPRGLKGRNIPLAARITTIVDIYDALVHERVYKKAFEEDEAINMMRGMSGEHLDPELFSVFLHLLPVMRQIRSEVREETVEMEAVEA